MKVMKLNQTLYFDEEGYSCNSLEEARQESVRPEEAYFIKRQKVKIFSTRVFNDKSIDYKYVVYSMGGKLLFYCDDLHLFDEIKE